MPTYNMEKYIDKAIRSALSQTMEDFKIIIVDDNSSDNTANIISKFNDSRIRYIKNAKKLGPIKNFNRCISLSDAEYLVFLHADDLLKPQMLEKSYELMKYNPDLGYTFSPCEIINEKNEYLYLNKPFEEDFIWPGHELFKKHLFCNFVLFPSVLIRKACLDNIGNFDENLVYTADWDLWLRIEAHPYSVAYSKEPLAEYRIHSQSGTSQLENEGITEIEQYRLIQKHLNSDLSHKLLAEVDRKKIKRIFKRRVLRSCFVRSRNALFRGKVKYAWQKMAFIKKWREDPQIKFEYNAFDLYLSAFAILGIIIE